MKVIELNQRVETLEKNQTALLGSIENLTNVLVLLQTRLEQNGPSIEQQFTIAETEYEAAQPKVHRVTKKAAREMAAKESTERDTKAFRKEMASSEKRAWLTVLEHTAGIVRANMRKKVYNVKIVNQQTLGKVDCPDYRVYLRTSEHRPFKTAWNNAKITLAQAVEALADEVGY